ncbi:MAG: pyridoxamine 5'-phosphate oxidase family protein [Vicinamibacteria bacterium]
MLDQAIVCHVGITTETGPAVIPMGYARRGDELLLHGSARSRLLEEMASGGRVCVTVTLVDGNTAPDAAEIQGALWLRAERQGMEDGRVYLLIADATDACGNRAFACTTVGVVHDQLLASEQSLSAQEQAALQFCEVNGDAPASFSAQVP